MTIDGKARIHHTEPELAAKFRQMQATIDRYEAENRKLTEEKEELGGAYNDASLGIGYLEQRCEELETREKEYKRLLKEAVNEMAQLGGQCSDNAIHCCNCPFEECGKFSFHDEIMELIGGEE